MNTKTLGILAAATVLVAGVAALTLQRRDGSVRSAEARVKLFPGLDQALKDASRIVVARKDGTATLEKKDGAWGLVEKSGYPVEIEPVRKTLLALADMETVEAKTQNPALHADLGVEDPEKEGSKSTLVTVQDASGKELAKLIVGKAYESKNYSAAQQTYVRKPGESQAWLVKGQVETKENDADWLKKEIVKIPRERIRAVEIKHPDGQVVHVERAKPEQTDFTLANVPEGKELKYPTVASSLAGGLDYVNLEDVQPAGSVDFTTEPGPIDTFWTFDGLKVTVTCKEQDGKTYAQFAAAYEEVPAPTPAAEPAPETTTAPAATKSPDEVKKEVEELQARFSKWTYVLSSYNRSAYFKRMDDFVKDPAPPPAPEGATPDGEETFKIPSDLPPEIQEQIRKDLESKGHKSEVVPVPPKPDEPTPDDPGGEPKPDAPKPEDPKPDGTPPH